MSVKKHSSLDKVLDRLDRLDEAGLRTLAQRLARKHARHGKRFQIKALPATAQNMFSQTTPHGGRLLQTVTGKAVHQEQQRDACPLPRNVCLPHTSRPALGHVHSIQIPL